MHPRMENFYKKLLEEEKAILENFKNSDHNFSDEDVDDEINRFLPSNGIQIIPPEKPISIELSRNQPISRKALGLALIIGIPSSVLSICLVALILSSNERNKLEQKKVLLEEDSKSERKASFDLEKEKLAQERKQVALALWDTWDTTLSKATREDVSLFFKWAALAKTEPDYETWVEFFVLGNQLNTVKFKELLEKPPHHITSAFNETFDISRVNTIKSSVIIFLNTMEKVASAYLLDAADHQIIEVAFKESVSGYTKDLKDFIEKYRKIKEKDFPNAWKPLYDLVLDENGKWYKKSNQ